MKILLIPDSFKGTLTSKQVIKITKKELSQRYPTAQIESLPFADGGEGTLDCLQEVLKNYQIIHKKVTGCEADEIREVTYLIYQDIAIIESSLVMGLPFSKKNPSKTTTYGVGQLLLDALDKGLRKFIITLGGSSTNDGGAGMLAALGMNFYQDKKSFVPTGGSLKDITSIDPSHLDKRLNGCEFTILSDVTNPLLGSQGATYVYAEQKGATKEDLPLLEEGMKHFARLLNNHKEEIKGSGAAGGLGYGFLCLNNCQIVSGAQEILNLYHFDDKIKDADIIITGEGKTDHSSLNGKCISVIASHAVGKRLILLSGYVEPEMYEPLRKLGFCEIYSIQRDKNKSFAEIKAHAEDDLRASVVKYISC